MRKQVKLNKNEPGKGLYVATKESGKSKPKKQEKKRK